MQSKVALFFDKDGHLNEEGIMLYAEAMKLDRVDELPKEFHQAIEEHEATALRVMRLYQLIRAYKYDKLVPHPFLDGINEEETSSLDEDKEIINE